MAFKVAQVSIRPDADLDFPVVLPERTADLFTEVRKEAPELFELDETELRKVLKQKKRDPTSTAGMLRIRFWDEWQRAQGRSMNIHNIYRDICLGAQWLYTVKDVHWLAWILCPPSSYLAKCDERLDMLMRNLRDVSDRSAIDPYTDKVDIKLASLQFEMLKYFDERKNGAVVQRIEQVSRNMNVNATMVQQVSADSNELSKLVQNMSQEELLQKLDDLRVKEEPVIEVKAE